MSCTWPAITKRSRPSKGTCGSAPPPRRRWWRTSAPSTAFTRAFPSTPGVSGCSPGTTARRRATSAPTSWRGGFCSRRGISLRPSTTTAGNRPKNPGGVRAVLEAVAADCVFTTHTPVAAGHDAFGLELIVAHFGDFVRELGVPVERVLELARVPSAPGLFNMTRLALSGTRHVNGVSRIHGAVSARLCADQWPEVRPEDNPVGFVTNGVHVPTFLHQTWMDFFDRELGREWRERLRDPEFWSALERVPDERYWVTAQEVKARMLASVRERLQREYERKGLSPAQLRHVTRFLDPQRPGVLTLGFARRFATYKRATLLLRDRARLARLVSNPERPVLLLFAGQARS